MIAPEPYKISRRPLLPGKVITLFFLAVMAAEGTSAQASHRPERPSNADDPGCKSCISAAASLFARGQNNQAAQLLRQWSERCPGSAQLHLLLSTVLLRTGAPGEEIEKEAGKAASAAPALVPAHLQYAMALTNNQHPQRAVEEFKTVTELDPTNYEAWTALGSLYKQLHEDELSTEAAAKAAELEPGSRAVRFATLINLKKASKFQEAKAELKRLLASFGNSPEFMQDLSREALLIGAYSEAIEAGQHVSLSYPKAVAPLKTACLAQFMQHNYKDCLTSANRMLALDKKNAEALALRGLSLLRLGEKQEADRDIKEALSQQPNAGLPLLSAGMAQVLSGKYVQADESLHACLEADASNNQCQGLLQPLAHLELSRLRRKQGSLNEAEEEAHSASADKRFLAAALGLEAQAVLNLAQKPEIVQTASRLSSLALAANPSDPEALLAESILALKERRLEEALSLAARVELAEPSLAEPYLISFRIAEAQSNLKQEKEYLDRAQARSTQDADTLFFLSQVALSESQTDSAIELLRACLAQKVKAPEAAFALARLLQKKSSPEEALKYFRMSLAQGLTGKDAETARAALAASESAKHH